MKNKLVVIRWIPPEIADAYLSAIPTMIYNGEDAIFPHDCYDEVIIHPQTDDLMSEEYIDFTVEVVEY